MTMQAKQLACGPVAAASPSRAGHAYAARPHIFTARTAPPARVLRHQHMIVRASGTLHGPSLGAFPHCFFASTTALPPGPLQPHQPPLSPPPPSPAAGDEDDDFEARLASLKRAKGETPYGEGSKRAAKPVKPSGSAASRKMYDYEGEEVIFETTPHLGDLAVNMALGITVLWLPLSIASLGRYAFVRYKFTDRRISCMTNTPFQNEQLDAAYQEVKDVVTIGRGVGLWGDMLVTLRNGDKIEMRALPRFLEMKEYILKRRDELTGGSGGGKEAAEAATTSGQGFA